MTVLAADGGLLIPVAEGAGPSLGVVLGWAVGPTAATIIVSSVLLWWAERGVAHGRSSALRMANRVRAAAIHDAVQDKGHAAAGAAAGLGAGNASDLFTGDPDASLSGAARTPAPHAAHAETRRQYLCVHTQGTRVVVACGAAKPPGNHPLRARRAGGARPGARARPGPRAVDAAPRTTAAPARRGALPAEDSREFPARRVTQYNYSSRRSFQTPTRGAGFSSPSGSGSRKAETT